jgi:hypothetical protein
MIQIKNQIEQLKTSATRTGLIFSDNPVMYNLVQEMILKLEQIEGLIELENELHFTEVAEAVKNMYNKDDNLTHIYVNFQVRPVNNDKKFGVIDAKLYLK